MLRVHIKRDNTILYRIRGRWDLGYELIREETKEFSVWLEINALQSLQRFVCPLEKQGALESVR